MRFSILIIAIVTILGGFQAFAEQPKYTDGMVVTPAEMMKIKDQYEAVLYYGQDIVGAIDTAEFLRNEKISAIALAAPQGVAKNCILYIVDGKYDSNSIHDQNLLNSGDTLFLLERRRKGKRGIGNCTPETSQP
ncbi:MAG: hypothetical protein JKY49_09300 [Cohaesibacteraceae bacterium]|nr:hypothetical protein [Cohaesibacteraceae bacterium]MBL4875518.1 hypothetical protein [Cohaesibacteraceae bacterium]